MNRQDFKSTIRNLNRFEQDLGRLVKSAQKLAGGLGKDLGGVFDVVIQRRLEEANRLFAPLASILRLGGHSGESAGGAPSRPSKAAKPAARKRGKKGRGGRGRKLNLSADSIKSAMAQANGVKTKAAEILGVSIPTFNKYFRQA